VLLPQGLERRRHVALGGEDRLGGEAVVVEQGVEVRGRVGGGVDLRLVQLAHQLLVGGQHLVGRGAVGPGHPTHGEHRIAEGGAVTRDRGRRNRRLGGGRVAALVGVAARA
jgi:hypothetical protein